MNTEIDIQCHANYMGLWCIEPIWFQQAVDTIKSGVWSPRASAHDPGRRLFDATQDGIAVIPIMGAMMKGESKFGGTGTVQTRRAIRAAGQDKDIGAILLHIDSPGGHTAGTQELADDVREVGKTKPIHAHIDDLGASAALWVAVQATRVSANRAAQIGSIGVFGVLHDSSGQAEMKGVKVHLISSGEFKGVGTPGTEVTEAHLAHMQEIVDDQNRLFLQDISRGRQMPIAAVRELADGRSHIAAKAQKLGLIDVVQSFEETIKEIGRDLKVARAARKQKEAEVFSALDSARARGLRPAGL